tara:strand:+ start:54 stop:257 length:204 start_codon:yes stop_codon:yes gene_type:complete
MTKYDIITKTLKNYGRLDSEQLRLLNLLIEEIIDFDKQHSLSNGSLVFEILLEKMIMEVKLKNHQSY